jgi:hypothetical protein
MSVFCVIDDKYVLLYRILWVSTVPHFCGSDDCQREGQYEVRLEDGESVWADQNQRDETLKALAAWSESGNGDDEDETHG